MKDIDEANAKDPRAMLVDGLNRAVELVYAERMSACLLQIYPQASELLQIAARGQHIRRWDNPRARYPLGRDGYNAWRKDCREHHASLITAILHKHGYSADEAARVASIIKKENLKRDPDSQSLENVAGIVFMQYYLDDFLARHTDYDQERITNIIAKTLRKMSSEGHAAVLALPLAAPVRAIIEDASRR